MVFNSNHDGTAEGRLASAHLEVLTDPGQEEAEGVGEAVLQEGDEEGGHHNSPGSQTSVWPGLILTAGDRILNIWTLPVNMKRRTAITIFFLSTCSKLPSIIVFIARSG